ncbi:MAG: cupin domain-containing protein [Bacteroidales bacterium]|nr:cupin domain-containing protein [Bacteroidales bacterium]
MVIDFDKIEMEEIPHFKGGEGVTKSRMLFDGTNKIMRGMLEPGCTIGYHCHDTSSEMIYILSGEARCLYDDGEERLVPGQCHYCPKGHGHSLINASATETLTYFAVVPEQ